MLERDEPGLGEVCRLAAWDAMSRSSGASVPREVEAISRDLAYVSHDLVSVKRDLNAATADTGGYLLGQELSRSWWDFCRTFAPLDRIVWRLWRQNPARKGREYEWVRPLETSRQPGSRWGGAYAIFHPVEGRDLSAPKLHQPQVATTLFVMNRITALSKVSNDLLSDAIMLEEMLGDTAQKEMACLLLDQLIGGQGYGAASILNSSGTITVAAEGGQTSKTINITNIDKMWARLWDASRANAVWLVAADTLLAIDSLATTEAWPTSIYMHAGQYGSTLPRLKGVPLITVEQCLPIGQLGDIILMDPTQSACVYLAMDEGIEPATAISAMSAEMAYKQVIMRRRMTSDRYWDTNETAFLYTFRGDIKPLWDQPKTIENAVVGSNSVSAFVTLAPRP
jgi:HK97 family phage major capsid protein